MSRRRPIEAKTGLPGPAAAASCSIITAPRASTPARPSFSAGQDGVGDLLVVGDAGQANAVGQADLEVRRATSIRSRIWVRQAPRAGWPRGRRCRSPADRLHPARPPSCARGGDDGGLGLVGRQARGHGGGHGLDGQPHLGELQQQVGAELALQKAQHVGIGLRLHRGPAGRASSKPLVVSILTASRRTLRLTPRRLHSSASMGSARRRRRDDLLAQALDDVVGEATAVGGPHRRIASAPRATRSACEMRHLQARSLTVVRKPCSRLVLTVKHAGRGGYPAASPAQARRSPGP